VNLREAHSSQLLQSRLALADGGEHYCLALADGGKKAYYILLLQRCLALADGGEHFFGSLLRLVK
jgi:hypothetical protein